VSSEGSPLVSSGEKVPRRVFRSDGSTIRVESRDVSALRWLTEFLVPPFVEENSSPADHVVRLVVDASRYESLREEGSRGSEEANVFQLDSGFRALPIAHLEGGCAVAVDDRQRVVYRIDATTQEVEILTRPGNAACRTGLLQVTRELAMARSWRSKRLLAHAAGLSKNERTLLLAGPKQAGKTTLLLHCLRASGTEILSQDRTLLELGGEAITARGVPTFASIRAGTLDLLPEIARRVHMSPYGPRLTLAECEETSTVPVPRGGERYLTPAQFSRVVERPICESARLAGILFPEQARGDCITLNRLQPDEARSRLRDTLFGSTTRGRPASFFSPGAPMAEDAAMERRCDEVVRCTPVFSASIGVGAFSSSETAVELVERLLA